MLGALTWTSAASNTGEGSVDWPNASPKERAANKTQIAIVFQTLLDAGTERMTRAAKPAFQLVAADDPGTLSRLLK